MTASRRARAVHLASQVLDRSGVLARTLRSPATHFVYLHHVPDLRWFELTLRQLATTFELISYSQGLERVRTGDHPTAALCLSFDDGFASSGTAADLALTEFGVTTALYICPGLVGATDSQTAEFFGAPQPELPMAWDAIGELASAGHIIGSHTMTHTNMAEASADRLREELEQSRSAIVNQLGACDHFAWPYGRARHFSGEAFHAARQAGYSSVASAVRGSHADGQVDDIVFRHVAYTDGDARSLRTHLAMGIVGVDGRRDERGNVRSFAGQPA